MKFKLSFVTNSSTTSFVILTQRKMFKKDIKEKIKRSYLFYLESFKLKNKKELIEYIQQGDYDFINDVLGPREYITLSHETYIEIKNSNQENFITFLGVNRNSIDIPYEDYIKKIIKTESDVEIKLLEMGGG